MQPYSNLVIRIIYNAIEVLKHGPLGPCTVIG